MKKFCNIINENDLKKINIQEGGFHAELSLAVTVTKTY